MKIHSEVKFAGYMMCLISTLAFELDWLREVDFASNYSFVSHFLKKAILDEVFNFDCISVFEAFKEKPSQFCSVV